MSRTRTERLVNLVICLLSTRRFLTAAQIAATVPGYEHDPEDPRDHEAFQRKFERDKAELRELGVPLETGTASVFDTEPGYRIAHREYALPDIPLAPDEAAAVGIAARLWQHAGLAAAASSGLAKLRAARRRRRPAGHPRRRAGGHRRPGVRAAHRRRPGPPGGHLRLPGARATTPPDPPAAAVGRGVLAGPVVRRRPRPGPRRRPAASGCPGSSARSGGSAGRGAYDAARDVDLISYVASWSGPVERTGRATVLVRPGRAAGLRRWAGDERARPGRRPARCCATPTPDCWPAGSSATARTCGCSDPPEVREAVIQRLKEIVARHDAVAGLGGGRRRDRGGGVTSADRLGRLLNLVPYLLARPGIEVAEAAADLGVTERQLREDLELLWVCGLPGYGPGDLIDMAFDGDRVTITYDAGIDRPLRLTPDEALALVVALRMLAETPGRRPTGTASSGPSPRSRTRPATSPTRRSRSGCPATPSGWTSCAPRSSGGRALRITYYTAARDETTERVVDPMRVLMVGGRAYLEAWCRRAEARPAVPGRPDRRLHRAGRAGPVPPAQADRHDVRRRRVPPHPGPAAGHAAGRAGAPGGSPSTTRARRSRAGRRALDGLAARHRPGLGPPAGARPRPRGHRGRRRRSWPRRCRAAGRRRAGRVRLPAGACAGAGRG